MGKHIRRRPLGRPKSRWQDNIKHILKKQDEKSCTGFVWLRIKTSGGLLQKMIMNLWVL
jgi:hypothetical protein